MTALYYEKDYRARRPFQYDEQLDTDQVFRLKGGVNDERLVRLNFCDVVPDGIRVVQCGKCGAKFVNDFALDMHGKKRHERKANPMISDAPLPRVSPEDIQRMLKNNTFLSEAELQAMGGIPQAPEDVEDPAERRMLAEPERQIRMDRTAATLGTGADAYEVQTETPAPAPETTRRGRR